MDMRVAGKGKGSSGNSNRSTNTNTNTINPARKERDIYNRREGRLRYWLERVSSLSEHDSDIMGFVQYLLDRETSALRIVRCLNALMIARIGRDFRDCTPSDVRRFVAYMVERNYSPDTQSTYRTILKYFFKVVYGNNEYYPEAVSWVRNRVSKDRAREKESLSYNDFLTEEEIMRLIDAANTLQKKAFIAVGYETGARPEELLNIRIRDILFDSRGARGKTGERITRVIAYSALLREWLSIHQFRNDPDSYLWL